MSDLDEKLEQLLKALVFDEWHDDSYLPSYKKAIKQAFADDGYIDTKPLSVTDLGELGHPQLYNGNGVRLMTGQEWYERFEKELNEWSSVTIHSEVGDIENLIGRDITLKAAKRAARVEE